MLLLYAIPIGLLAGRLTGGRLSSLTDFGLRWGPLALGGLFFQLALFSEPLASRVASAGPMLYVGSTLVVLIVILRNVAAPGMAVIALGALLNLAAIVANGGQMPADPAAVAALTGGSLPTDSFTNSTLAGPGTVLAFLGDTMVMPRPIPLANVFSVGDVLIGLGAVIFLMRTMRRSTPAPAAKTTQRRLTITTPRAVSDGG